MGLTVHVSKAAQTESVGNQSAGDAVQSLPSFPGAVRGVQGKADPYLNTPRILTAEQLSDSLFGGNRAWRVDKKNPNPAVTPTPVIPPVTPPAMQGGQRTGPSPASPMSSPGIR